MGTRKRIGRRLLIDGRRQPELVLYLILKFIKEVGPTTAYRIWTEGPVVKSETVKRHLCALLLGGAIEKQKIDGKTVYSITRMGLYSLKSMAPLFESMIFGRALSSTIEDQESQYTSQELTRMLTNLVSLLKKKGVIDADYQLSAENPETQGPAKRANVGEQQRDSPRPDILKDLNQN